MLKQPFHNVVLPTKYLMSSHQNWLKLVWTLWFWSCQYCTSEHPRFNLSYMWNISSMEMLYKSTKCNLGNWCRSTCQGRKNVKDYVEERLEESTIDRLTISSRWPKRHFLNLNNIKQPSLTGMCSGNIYISKQKSHSPLDFLCKPHTSQITNEPKEYAELIAESYAGILTVPSPSPLKSNSMTSLKFTPAMLLCHLKNKCNYASYGLNGVTYLICKCSGVFLLD